MDCALTGQGNDLLTSKFWEKWTEYQDQLYRCCLKFMNSNPTDAEDALSQAMLKAWEKVQIYAGKIDNLKAWLFKLTSNLCIDLIRKRSQGAVGVESIEWVGDTEEIGIGSNVASPESCLEREEKSTEIQQAIADLPETLRETFILHFYQELTHTEIAQRQGITYDNVCRRIYRARKQLKEKLSSYYRGTEEKVISCQLEDSGLGLTRGRGDAGTRGSCSNGQLCRHDRSVTVRVHPISSTLWENEEKPHTYESQGNIGLETVTVSPSLDTQLHSKTVVETDLDTWRHGDREKMNVLRLKATWYIDDAGDSNPCSIKTPVGFPVETMSKTMLKAWEKVQKYAGKIDNLKAWLFKLTSNLCIDIIREPSQKAVGVESIEWVGDTEEMGIASNVASPESCLERLQDSTVILQAVADLPETLRDTFILHINQERTHTEIAQRQGVSNDDVCWRKYRARKQLKGNLSGYFRGAEEKVISCQVEDSHF
ncbi:MAG: sigma-70 family RNA polymerase sigma factor [Okeania sp. SIO3B5]|uniref:RNA polymerase sigma factor n=1 Tax=Okeania sp. SIO3B5 TaxID=2607811 RepID=UPI001401915C|nr:sigma-70 family RNA polymerase sigma factor [Okeania sp. SIO3B5]NEO54373.1 sigma-70 family RNA polymerase sigma factor [Okeania sp. SIO3B5]